MLARQLTPTAINTWFSECEPVELTGNCLVIRTPSNFKREVINKNFSFILREKLTELFANEYDVLVLTDEEVEPYKSSQMNGSADRSLPDIEGFTFESFVAGDCNRSAYSFARMAADRPGDVFNPLLLYGASGLGKTHLLISIGKELQRRDLKARIAYVKGDDFTNQLVSAIRQGEQDQFREKYRKLDLLLVDDIQFIAGKQATQEEFFHTFDSLYQAKGQIVLTSDRPPKEMALLDERLRTRFEGGLMAMLETPGPETRIEIIRNKAARFGLDLPEEYISYIGNEVTSNVRQLEGVLKRLCAYKAILNDTISLDSVKRAVDDVTHTAKAKTKPEDIIRETARYFNLTGEALQGSSKSKNVSRARHIAMFLMRRLTALSFTDIGNHFSGRNHATVIKAVKDMEALVRTDKEMAEIIQDIIDNICN